MATETLYSSMADSRHPPDAVGYSLARWNDDKLAVTVDRFGNDNADLSVTWHCCTIAMSHEDWRRLARHVLSVVGPTDGH